MVNTSERLANNSHCYSVHSDVVKDVVCEIKDDEFLRIQNYLYMETGIHLGPEKKQMIVARLACRLKHYNLSTFSEYLRLVMGGDHDEEKQEIVDLLTTNETYFYREPAHFDFLREQICENWQYGRLFRAWSAASSSGEEAYSMAMIFSEGLPQNCWELIGSDISRKVLDMARAAYYPIEKTRNLPAKYLEKHCLKGVRSQNGVMLIDESLRKKVQFIKINLNKSLEGYLGMFDVIFLRNVLIYFDLHEREKIVHRVIEKLNKGGYLFVSHTESVTGYSDRLQQVVPSIYKKI